MQMRCFDEYIFLERPELSHMITRQQRKLYFAESPWFILDINDTMRNPFRRIALVYIIYIYIFFCFVPQSYFCNKGIHLKIAHQINRIIVDLSGAVDKIRNMELPGTSNHYDNYEKNM